jgi:hypothetical protein
MCASTMRPGNALRDRHSSLSTNSFAERADPVARGDRGFESPFLHRRVCANRTSSVMVGADAIGELARSNRDSNLDKLELAEERLRPAAGSDFRRDPAPPSLVRERSASPITRLH